MVAYPTYLKRKAAGVCPICERPPRPGNVHCADCIADLRHYRERALTEEQRQLLAQHRHGEAVVAQCRQALPLLPDREARWAGPAYACCGTWHPVPCIPYTLPCCGRVIALVEEAAHA